MHEPRYYTRLSINPTLNRLDHPAEPVFLLLKAYLHAVTSFVLPDPLTKRTDVEEALALLTSGAAQPWQPLGSRQLEILRWLSELTPIRAWAYELRSLAKTTWSSNHAICSQHDDFGLVVDSIVKQSNALRVFSLTNPGKDEFGIKGNIHVLLRAKKQNDKFRAMSFVEQDDVEDATYLSRIGRPSNRYRNVYENASALRAPSGLRVEASVVSVLQKWSTFGGFASNPAQLTLLSDLIHLDLSLYFGSIFNFCQQSRGIQEHWKYAFFFAALSINKNIPQRLLHTLMAVFILPEVKTLTAPITTSYQHFRPDQTPTVPRLAQLVLSKSIPYDDDIDPEIRKFLSRKQARIHEQQKSRYEQLVDDQCRIFARHIMAQWPDLGVTLIGCPPTPLLDIEAAWKVIEPQWSLFVQNKILAQFIVALQFMIDPYRNGEAQSPGLLSSMERLVWPTFSSSKVTVCIADLLDGATDNLSTLLADSEAPMKLITVESRSASKESKAVVELKSIVSKFSSSSNLTRKKYGQELQGSIAKLQSSPSVTSSADYDMALLPRALVERYDMATKLFTAICESLSRQHEWLRRGGLFPRLTPTTLLATIRSSDGVTNSILKPALIRYGLILAELQRLARIDTATREGNVHIVKQELANIGHTSWKVAEHPDWLLLELENNVLIRDTQYKVAMEMMSPRSGENTVAQLNMGEGRLPVPRRNTVPY
jgi:hypothetical protein